MPTAIYVNASLLFFSFFFERDTVDVIWLRRSLPVSLSTKLIENVCCSQAKQSGAQGVSSPQLETGRSDRSSKLKVGRKAATTASPPQR